MKTLDTVHTLYSREKAERVAEEMSANDDWKYEAVHDPKGTGLSFIEIHDEDGELVGRM